MEEVIKKYLIDGEESEVFAVSLVDQPAIESDWIALAKQERQQIMLRDDKRHMLYGCVLRADFPIYRYNEQYGEYYLQFSKEAINAIEKRYMRDGLLQSFTVDHEEEVGGIYITESWIKEDEQFDKSVKLGIGKDCAVGSWFVGAYVDSNDLWKKIEAGDWNGFSVEAMVAVAEEQIFSKQTPEKEEEVKLEEAAPAPEPVQETPEANEEPSVNEPPPVPTEDKVEEQTPENEEVKDEEVEQPNPLDDVVKQLQAEIEALKNKNDELEESVKGLKKENKKLSQLPSANPTNTTGGNKNGDTWRAWREAARRFY